MLAITLDVAQELRCPVVFVSSRVRSLPAARMLMPKAAVDKNGKTLRAENNVWLSRQSPDVKSITKPASMERSPQE